MVEAGAPLTAAECLISALDGDNGRPCAVGMGLACRSEALRREESLVHRHPLFEAFVMVLLGSSLALLASAAGLVTLGSSYILGEVSAVAFAVSLFILICATEANT